eukprot:12488020-Alexandrium_andersonii.AAC.1
MCIRDRTTTQDGGLQRGLAKPSAFLQGTGHRWARRRTDGHDARVDLHSRATTPEADHRRPEPGKVHRPHGSPPLGCPRRIAAGFHESSGPEGGILRRPGKWPPDLGARIKNLDDPAGRPPAGPGPEVDDSSTIRRAQAPTEAPSTEK